MNSLVTRHAVRIDGEQLYITIEDDFWISLEEIAARMGRTTSQLLALIDSARAGANLASAIRVYVVDHFRTQADCLDDLDDADDLDEPSPPACARPRWLN
jgi:predicted DNA-binding ribbon-helix-helix protein